VRGVAAIIGLFVAIPFGGCESNQSDVSPSRTDCQRLREHIAGLVVERAGADSPQVEKHRRSLANVGGEESLARCAREQTRKQIDCALAAATLDKVTRCLHSQVRPEGSE